MAIKTGKQHQAEPSAALVGESEQLGPQRSLVLIRHGTTSWNVEKKYLGHTDIALLPDANEELAILREQCRDLTWDAVYCSDLLRCRQTLAHIAPLAASEARLDRRLRENDFGEWEGLTYEQLKHNPIYQSWIDHPQEVTPPGGEAWSSFAERMDSFLDEHICSMDDVRLPQSNPHRTLIVTHGGVIRYMLSRLLDGVGFWDTHVIPGQAIQVHLQKQGERWLGRRGAFPPIGL
ncbi:histidine phosphatase family protein [Paenibacillus silvae]|uniref:histidine phosphatase family protein n=1 Tax=Paenibacillus silvae TaxID=1325358 RepID=UPI002003C4C4|nr:histidine phosphatase family protein [Paenibacillus silvae]MCK6074762.1 histidine phosphatase family protein [Paenibacillus silvae]MCK6147763.1 histidine phosphatase family protein [Paenibacillus silvae]MCK6266061.1 histidine phosphatase family protein [Paenibacillus silvae]